MFKPLIFSTIDFKTVLDLDPQKIEVNTELARLEVSSLILKSTNCVLFLIAPLNFMATTITCEML